MPTWHGNVSPEIYEKTALFRNLIKGAMLGVFVGVASGCASALFLYLLHGATEYREAHPWLLFLLPLAGLFIAWAYDRYGTSVAAGTNLLLERIRDEDTAAIPFRMVPLVLGGTVLTHLFGGSAGREGTAVQMGGTLANLLTRPLRLSRDDHRLLIMSGISGGFGSVFGTPLAGTVFGLEVLSRGRIHLAAVIPCFVASYVGDVVCRALGIHHTTYSAGTGIPDLTPLRWLLILAASALFAGAAWGFIALTEGVGHFMKARVASPLLRPLLGGLAVIGLAYLVGTRDYLGLSLPLIARSFSGESIGIWVFALKILFTAVTLGTSFKGGEVTPLFCIGATLGAAMAHVTGQPPAFFAALGFVAVFAGAAKTPLACVFLGVEIFGSGMAVPCAAACLIAYTLSGERGLYSSQRVGTPDSDMPGTPSGGSVETSRDSSLEMKNIS